MIVDQRALDCRARAAEAHRRAMEHVTPAEHQRWLESAQTWISRFFMQKSWSPYVVGIGISVLSWFAFTTANKPISITTAFEYTAGLAEKAATPAIAEPYLQPKAKDGKGPKIDWEWMLVVGVFAGAWLSARMSNDRTERSVPPVSEWRRLRPTARGKALKD